MKAKFAECSIGFLTVLGVCLSPVQALEKDDFFDPDDGYLDLSGLLDDPYGFIPLVVPITEPAIGYGAVIAPVFIQSNDVEGDPTPRKPNIFGAGAMFTENGSQGLFGFHSGSWKDDRIHTMAAAFDVGVNLDFYGVGVPGPMGEVPLSYTMDATGLMLEGSMRVGDSDWWLGLGYSFSDVDARYQGLPINGFSPPSFRTDVGTLAMVAKYEAFNNFFTPTGGCRWDFKLNLSDPAFGAEGTWQSASVRTIHYWTLDEDELWNFGIQARVDAAFNDPPFYLNPFVQLRGVPAMRYQGDLIAELEAELRYQFHPRYSVLAFAGVGGAWQDDMFGDSSEDVIAGGLGFRYLLAKDYGMHMGIDVGYSADNGAAIYFQFGSAWLSF